MCLAQGVDGGWYIVLRGKSASYIVSRKKKVDDILCKKKCMVHDEKIFFLDLCMSKYCTTKY